MPNTRRSKIRGRRCARSSTQMEMSGGSRETEVKELAVMPWTRPGAHSAVTTVTPVANWLRARRKSSNVSGADDIDFPKITQLEVARREWRVARKEGRSPPG